jgi:hypothetical protein
MIGVIETSLAADDSEKTDRTRLTWPKLHDRRRVGGALHSLFPFFLIPSDALSGFLFMVSVVFAIPLVVFSLQALFRRRWKLMSIYALVWVLLCVPFTRYSGPHHWLRVLGFYVHTRLVGDYLSICQLTEFVENGVKQTAGVCGGFNRSESIDGIIYDTTGEIMQPVSQRTPEWERAMESVILREVVMSERPAEPLFGKCYWFRMHIHYLED